MITLTLNLFGMVFLLFTFFYEIKNKLNCILFLYLVNPNTIDSGIPIINRIVEPVTI